MASIACVSLKEETKKNLAGRAGLGRGGRRRRPGPAGRGRQGRGHRRAGRQCGGHDQGGQENNLTEAAAGADMIFAFIAGASSRAQSK